MVQISENTHVRKSDVSYVVDTGSNTCDVFMACGHLIKSNMSAEAVLAAIAAA